MAGANDYQTAVQIWYEVDPGMILSDLMLPGLDGWEIIQGMRKVTKSPVIMVSAASFQENILKGFGIGTKDYLVKPFHNPEVIACVKKVLRNTSYTHCPNIRQLPDSGIIIDLEAHGQEMEHVQEFS
jgi:DNA-binding response OmpR family regulator